MLNNLTKIDLLANILDYCFKGKKFIENEEMFQKLIKFVHVFIGQEIGDLTKYIGSDDFFSFLTNSVEMSPRVFWATVAAKKKETK